MARDNTPPPSSGLRRDSTFKEKDASPIQIQPNQLPVPAPAPAPVPPRIPLKLHSKIQSLKQIPQVNTKFSMTLSHIDLNCFNFDEQEKEETSSNSSSKESEYASNYGKSSKVVKQMSIKKQRSKKL